MKKLAKVLSLALVLVMVLSLGGTAWATTWDDARDRPVNSPAPIAAPATTHSTSSGEGNFTVTVVKNSTDKAAHTYAAYQIFAGDLLVENNDHGTTGDTTDDTVDRTLSNITWGSGIDTSKLSDLRNALVQINTSFNSIVFEDTAASAQAVASAITSLSAAHDSDTAQKIAAAFASVLKSTGGTSGNGGNEEVSGLTAGYYLIKDSADVTGEGAQTRFILEVVADVTVYEKASVPSVEKKVQEKNDSAAASATNPTGWQDAADYDIGDSVPFQLTATMASTTSDYKTYHIVFQDKQSEGLDLPDASTFKFSIPDVNINNIVFSGFDTPEEITDETNHVTIKVTLQNKNTSKTGSDKFIELNQTFAVKVEFVPVAYNHGENTTFADPTLPSAYNGKEIIVEYSSVLNSNAKLGAIGNPNEVYLKFSNNPNSEDDSEEGKTPTDKVTVFTYEIKTLKVEPTSDPAIIEDAYDMLTDTEKADYVKVGDKWQKVQALNGAGFTLFKKVPEASLQEPQKSGKKNSFTEAKEKGNVVQSGDEWYIAAYDEITGVTTFEFVGTDAGDYKLVETTTPAGYNSVADVDFTVAATYETTSDDPVLTDLTVTPTTAGFVVTAKEYGTDTTGDTSDDETSDRSILETKILNRKGTELPSTGGVGTTLFYVFGSMLVIAAAVYFVTKKRSEVE